MDSPCDAAGRPELVELDDATVVRDIAYDPTGQPKSFTYGNSLHTEVGLDDRGRTLTMSSPAVELVWRILTQSNSRLQDRTLTQSNSETSRRSRSAAPSK